MPLQLEDLAALDSAATGISGKPLMLPLADIDEDPEQPRQEFEEDSLQILADSIRQRGVLQPVSVRPHPTRPGRWMLNFGARRLRACRLAALDSVPAFVDQTADSYDQVNENEQREGLRPLELALFVQKRLALGDMKADVARRLGKSRQWVTYVTAMIDPPDWLLEVYRAGRCHGLNELYELRRLHERYGERVSAWAAWQANVTRDRVLAFKAELDRCDSDAAAASAGRSASSSSDRVACDEAAFERSERTPRSKQQARANRAAAHVASGPEVLVLFEERVHRLVIDVVPEQPGSMYVIPVGGGVRRLAPVAALTLLGYAVDDK